MSTMAATDAAADPVGPGSIYDDADERGTDRWVQCAKGEIGKYWELYGYPRTKRHSRMDGTRAFMYCGKTEKSDDEAAFGFLHIRDGHRDQFVRLAEDDPRYRSGAKWI